MNHRIVTTTAPPLLVISAPSGVGKTTVTNRFLQTTPGWKKVITCTTRRPRPKEQDGVDYRFLTEKSFDLLVRSGRFLEHAVVHGQFYGTLMSDVQTVWDSHNGAILVIDTQGKECVKAELPQAVTVFLLPPSNMEMERRLRDRGTDTEAIIQARLHRATTEIKDAYTYDEVIVNYDINDTVKAIRKLILG